MNSAKGGIMSNISSFNSAVRGYDRGDLERFSSRSSEQREAVSLSKNESLELSLTTKEGDVVTLSTESFMDFASLSYDKSGSVSDGYQTASTAFSSREMTLASGSQFSFSVQGNLSEDELNDIENLVKTLDEVAYAMSSGDMDQAMETAMEMASEGYDSLSGFEADLSFSSAYRYEKESASQQSNSIGGGGGDARAFGGSHTPDLRSMTEAYNSDSGDTGEMGSLLTDSSSRLLEMMLEELDKMKEKGDAVPTRAADPVDQLLAHHMDQIPGQEDEDPGEMDGAKGRGSDLLNQLATAREGLKNEFGREFRKVMSEALSAFKV